MLWPVCLAYLVVMLFWVGFTHFINLFTIDQKKKSTGDGSAVKAMIDNTLNPF